MGRNAGAGIGNRGKARAGRSDAVTVAPAPSPAVEPMPNDLHATSDLGPLMLALGESARAASRVLARSSTAARNRALEAAADTLVDRERTLLAANAADVKAARAEGRDD